MQKIKLRGVLLVFVVLHPAIHELGVILLESDPIGNNSGRDARAPDL